VPSATGPPHPAISRNPDASKPRRHRALKDGGFEGAGRAKRWKEEGGFLGLCDEMIGVRPVEALADVGEKKRRGRRFGHEHSFDSVGFRRSKPLPALNERCRMPAQVGRVLKRRLTHFVRPHLPRRRLVASLLQIPQPPLSIRFVPVT
jgi:hypothetical protein